MREQFEALFEEYRKRKYFSTDNDAIEFVETVERVIDQLPEIEADVIRERYMNRDYDYINDYTIYEGRIPMSRPTFAKVRQRAFEKLHESIKNGLLKDVVTEVEFNEETNRENV